MAAAPTAATAASWMSRVGGLMQQVSDPALRDDALGGLAAVVLELDPVVSGSSPGAGDADALAAYVYATTTLASELDDDHPQLGSRLELFERARRGAERYGSADHASWVELRLAQHLHESGRLERAVVVLRQSLRDHPEAVDSEFQRRHFVAELLRQQSRWNEALDELAAMGARLADVQSSWTASPTHAPRWHGMRAAMLGSWAQVLRRIGLADQAALKLREQGEEARRSGMPQLLAQHALAAADFDLLTERFDHALTSLTDAARQPWYGTLPASTRARFTLTAGLALSELEREDAARDRRAARVLRQVLEEDQLGQIMSLKAELTLADLALRAADLAEAEAVLARARERFAAIAEPDDGPLHQGILLAAHETRLLLARGADTEALRRRLPVMESSYRELLQQWARTPVRPGGIGFLNMANRRQVLSTLIRLVLASQGPRAGVETALDLLLEAEALGSVSRRLGLAATTVAEVRRSLLTAGGGVLLYLPSKERSHLFVVDADDARHYELPARDVLDRPVRDLLTATLVHPSRLATETERARHGEELWARSRALSRALLPSPVVERLAQWTSVSFVGLDMLGNPPVDALVLPDDRMLGWKLAIDRPPSLALAVALAQRPAPAPHAGDAELLLVAHPTPDPELSDAFPDVRPLPFAEREAARLLRAYGTSRSRLALGDDAAPESLAGAALERTPIVHVLAHGIYDPSRERGAALVLPSTPGDDGLLDCAEVERDLSVSGLVILSACGAGRGPARLGDDQLSHLGGAFLMAGARAVLLSRAQLELGPTLALMEALHSALSADGATPAGALRDARAELASTADVPTAFAHAQFEIIGLGHRPVVTRR